MDDVVVVQSLSHVWLFATTRTTAHQAHLSCSVSFSLLRFLSVESVTLSLYCRSSLRWQREAIPASGESLQGEGSVSHRLQDAFLKASSLPKEVMLELSFGQVPVIQAKLSKGVSDREEIKCINMVMGEMPLFFYFQKLQLETKTAKWMPWICWYFNWIRNVFDVEKILCLIVKLIWQDLL